MTEAEKTPNTPRRHLLAATIGAPFAGGALVLAMPIEALAGMLSKAKAAIRHASKQPGLDVVRGERSTVAEGWAWDLLHDLLRLHDVTGRI